MSRNRIFPSEEEGKDDEENGLHEMHTLPNGLTNGLPPQLSDVEFRQLTGPNSPISQDQTALTVVAQSENESRVRPPTSPGGLMKRRNSNLANCEKILQEMNATSSDACPRQRKDSASTYAAILEFADEVNQENEGENRERAQSDHGDEGNGHPENENEPDGVKKPEDPNQALLQYFAKLSSSADVDDSLDLEHIQSLLNEGASVNTSDRFGQTLLHEVSRTWGVDVAKFFIEQGMRIIEK